MNSFMTATTIPPIPPCTIFSASGCQFCERAKETLASHSIPFTSLDVEIHTKRFEAVTKETNISTVPQIFFYTKPIGGFVALLALLNSEQLMTKLQQEQQNFSCLQLKDIPEFLRPLSAAELQLEIEENDKRQSEENYFTDNFQFCNFSFNVSTLSGSPPTTREVSISFSEIHDALLPRRNDTPTKKTSSSAPTTALQFQQSGCLWWKKQFLVSGSELVRCITLFLERSAAEDAPTSDINHVVPMMCEFVIRTGMLLLANTPTTLSLQDNEPSPQPTAFCVSAVYIPRDPPFPKHSMYVLNDHCIARQAIVTKHNGESNNTPKPDPNVLARAIWRAQNAAQASQLRDPATTSKFATTSRNLLLLLQLVDLKQMNDTQKTAFGINLYNALVHIGFSVVGLPHSLSDKIRFFGSLGVFIGRDFYSLNDIENGLLRGNRKGMTDLLSPPFSSHDRRIENVVTCPDCRIHAALNCGANSCPPLKIFSEGSLDSELNAAMRGFIESTSLLDPAGEKIFVSKIFDWYKEDFKDANDIRNLLIRFLPQSLHEKINNPQLSICFSPYDWRFSYAEND